MILLLLATVQDLDRLTRDLGADDYDVREKATKDLLGLGRDAVPRVRAAWKRAADPEVKSRLRLHLRAFDTWSQDLLTTMPEGSWNGGDIVFSPDGRHVAYTHNPPTGGSAWIIDGAPTDAYFWFEGGLAFSHDGSRVAFSMRLGEERFIVIDGKRGPSFDAIDGTPTFTADGKDVFYVAQRDKKWHLLRNETIVDSFPDCRMALVNPTGSIVVYTSPPVSPRAIIIGGEWTDFYDCVIKPRFLPDGKTFVCEAQKEGRWYAVNGTSRSEPLDHYPVLADDGRVVALLDQTDRKSRLIVDGMPGDAWEAICLTTVGPYGKTVAFAATQDVDSLEKEIPPRRWSIVVGSKLSEPFDTVWAPVFSADGKKVAFGARRDRELWWKVMDVE